MEARIKKETKTTETERREAGRDRFGKGQRQTYETEEQMEKDRDRHIYETDEQAERHTQT